MSASAIYLSQHDSHDFSKSNISFNGDRTSSNFLY